MVLQSKHLSEKCSSWRLCVASLWGASEDAGFERNLRIDSKSVISLLLILALLTGCSLSPETEPAVDNANQAAAESEADAVPTAPIPESNDQGGDGVVQGWAVLAEKDNYDDVNMTNLPVNYIGITQMQGLLLDSGWQEAQIHQAREFDRESLVTELDWLAENADQDDLVFVYVGAHGRYLQDVMRWNDFFGREWEEISSRYQVLVIDSCQAANYTAAISSDPEPYLSIAAVAGDEYGWSGLKEEGLPIIGGVFTHYFASAFQVPEADTNGDGQVSAQEAALWAETQQRTYMHEVVFAVPQFVEDYHAIGAYPDQDPEFPHVVVNDTVGMPVFLTLE
jgi:hypothetical protein